MQLRGHRDDRFCRACAGRCTSWNRLFWFSREGDSQPGCRGTRAQGKTSDDGHDAGDKIIVQIAKLFKDKFRGSDIACRYGGEELIVILPESTKSDTIKRANSIREEIKKMEIVFQGQILGSITMSMGIAAYPDNGLRMDELLRVADTALYRAKQEGRDKVISG